MVSAFKFADVYIIPFFELIPVLVGILYYKHLSKPLRLIFYFAILYVVMDSLNSVMAIIFHQQSKPYTDTLAILELPLVSAFYMQVLSKRWKTPIIILLVAYYLLWIADYWFIEPGSPMNVYPLAFESMIIMLYATVYMNQQTQTNIEEQWGANPINWISSGFLIYCASYVLLTLFYNLMLEKHVGLTFFIILWEINTLAVVIQSVLISIGIYKWMQSRTISL